MMLPEVLIPISPSRCRQSPIWARESLISPSTALGVAVAALLSRFCRGPEVSIAVGFCRCAVLVLLLFFFFFFLINGFALLDESVAHALVSLG